MRYRVDHPIDHVISYDKKIDMAGDPGVLVIKYDCQNPRCKTSSQAQHSARSGVWKATDSAYRDSHFDRNPPEDKRDNDVSESDPHASRGSHLAWATVLARGHQPAQAKRGGRCCVSQGKGRLSNAQLSSKL